MTLLCKNVSPNKVELDVQKREVSVPYIHQYMFRMFNPIIQCHVTITLATGADSMFILDPLFHPVDPGRSYHEVLPSQIDVHLVKSVNGQHWAFVDDGNQPERIDPVVEPPPVIERTPRSVYIFPC